MFMESFMSPGLQMQSSEVLPEPRVRVVVVGLHITGAAADPSQ